MNVPDEAVLIASSAGFMIYVGLPLAKIIYESIFGTPERVTHPASRVEESSSPRAVFGEQK